MPLRILGRAAGLLMLGRLGLRETLGPVVDLAAEGFAMYPALQRALHMRADRYREDYPTTGEVYLHMGQVPALGWRLQKPAWSSTFRRIIDAEIARGLPRSLRRWRSRHAA